MKTVLDNVTVASKTSTEFKAKAGESINVNLSLTGTVSLQRKNVGDWVEVQSITTTTTYAVANNMVFRLVVTANAGVIGAEIV